MQQISMQIKITLLIVIFVFIGGCAGDPYQRYSGNHLTESTRATLKPWEKEIPRYSSESRFVLPLLIDGKETELPSHDQISMTSYYISPGEHKIKVALFAVVVGGKRQFINPKPMIFQAKTGHTYITKAYLPSLNQGDVGTEIKLSFWIEDENTGEVVSGTRLTE